MSGRESRHEPWWVDTGRRTFWTSLQAPRRFWLKGGLDTLDGPARDTLVTAQVEATRPAFSVVIGIGGLFLMVVGAMEAMGATPGIGYGAALTVLAGLCVVAIAVALWRLQPWYLRLTLTLVAMGMVGMFLSVPMPGVDTYVLARIGLFNLLPITLLALLVRPMATWLLVAVVVLVSILRVALHGTPPGGLWLHALYLVAIVALGLVLRGYRTGFAIDAYRVRQQLWDQANVDALTGVLNRAGWNRVSVPLYQDAAATDRPTSLVYFDVDHFKQVNDTWGHERGDEVLQALGRVLHARQDDRIRPARVGGEEFAVLLVDMTEEEVMGFCRRVCDEFAQTVDAAGVTLSVGVAHRLPGEAMHMQLKRADGALYVAKRRGRNRIEVDGSAPAAGHGTAGDTA